MRPWFSIAAALLSIVAVVVSGLDGDTIELAIFVVAALLAVVQAGAVRLDPYEGVPRRFAIGIAVAWLLGATWAGVLLLGFQGDGPPPQPEELYLGLTATFYHALALFGGAVLVTIAALAPRSWMRD